MIKKVGVIGAGIMGHGIAEVIAVSGYEVTILDVTDEILSKAMEKIRWSIEHLVNTGKIKEPVESVLSRIATSTNFSELSGSDLVLEAVKEDTEVKRIVYGKLREVLKANAIVASNTSTIPISELGSLYGNDERFVGIHFSNPPVIMPIVEIIKGNNTSENALAESEEFVKSLGKEVVLVRKDVPGFLINRINDRTILEALTIMEDGYEPEILDAMVRFRLGFPMGMCELLDFVGIDTVYNANREMISRGFDTSSSEILRGMVERGTLGTKTGRGFYEYPKPGKYARPIIVPVPEMYSINPLRLLSPAINEAAWLLENGVCSAEDIEKAMKLAMNWPHGPLEYADRYGIDNVVAMLKKREMESEETRYVPNKFLLEKIGNEKLGLKTGEGFGKWDSDYRNFGTVDYTLMNDYALIELNRPDKLNSLDESSWLGLKEALVHAENDSRVRSVVLTGKGKAFCAGDDISMMGSWEKNEDAESWMKHYAEPLTNLIQSYSKPLISAVNGIAFGGGCELNILFDMVLAEQNAVFAIPEGLIGAMPPIASSLGYLFVNRKLARYAFTGDRFGAEEARELGLVDVVVPAGELNSAICEFTEKISRIAPLSAASIKRSMNMVRDTIRNQFDLSSKELVHLASTHDFKEGQKAFLSKRLPEWKGK